MASVYLRDGICKVQRTVAGKRVWATLGRVSRGFARDAEHHADSIEQAIREGRPTPPDAAAWLASLSDELHKAFERIGLAEARKGLSGTIVPTTVAKLFDDYLAMRTDLGKRSVANIRQAKRSLVAFLEPGRLASDVRPVEASDWRRKVAQDYSASTVSGFVKKAKQVFADAVERGHVESNPFGKLRAGKQSNRERIEFVDRARVDKVMAEADWRWKLVIALSRYGGLRCPSEVYALRWSGVLFDKGRIQVISPKTEKQGKGSRWVPMFPELRPLLAEALRHREPGDERVCAWMHADYNPHTQMLRLVERAGLSPWPRLFHNMRASRITELAKEYPIHVVVDWMGNTEAIAMTHYLSTTDDDFARAAKSAAPGRETTRNTAQDEAALETTTPGNAVGYSTSGRDPLPPRGIPLPINPDRKPADPDSSAAKSAAVAERYWRRAVGAGYRADLAAVAAVRLPRRSARRRKGAQR